MPNPRKLAALCVLEVSVDSPIFAPTDTEDWLRCPAYRDYNKRWHPRDNDYHPAKDLGTAIAAGLAVYYKALAAKVGVDPKDAVAVMQGQLERLWVPNDRWTLDGLLPIAAKGLRCALDLEVALPPATIVAVEETMHRARPDLLYRTPQGLVVHDWKVRFDLEKKWQDAALAEYGNSWQLRHYAWAASVTYGEPVHTVQIGLIVLTPRTHAALYPLPMSPERIAKWLETATVVWPRMAQDTAAGPLAPMNTKSCRTFPSADRRCPFYDLCHVFDRDESRAPALYTEVLK